MDRINQLMQGTKHKNALTTVLSNHRERHLGDAQPCCGRADGHPRATWITEPISSSQFHPLRKGGVVAVNTE